MITKEMWQDWKRHPVTTDYLNALNDKREQIKEGIAEGEGSTEYDRAVAIGRTQGIKDALKYALINFDYVELQQPQEEQDGAESGSVQSDSEG